MRQKGKRTKGIEQAHPFEGMSKVNPQALRSLLRHSRSLVDYRSPHALHMQKALLQVNIQPSQAVSDVTGVTGQAIIRAILSGVHNPRILALFWWMGVSLAQTKTLKSGFLFATRVLGPLKVRILRFHAVDHRLRQVDTGWLVFEIKHHATRVALSNHASS
jgi:hypothetical protein